MTTPLDLDGFPSAIYDRHFIEWNRVNTQFNNSISNDLPMFYHNQYTNLLELDKYIQYNCTILLINLYNLNNKV